ncbi:hypothetical protein C5Y96_23930 [Blastopirellula marina]|uniref:DUF309 domain-containing protein n=1 Tax=Blastopirellula marina TaxID=124 RepID=A0A2S8EZR2_9BACT|nr:MULTISPECIES: DUF309 domain-containing protein [Pirellulaceae]PQO25393.1 hypothetical protein C5Y96_23930 [Blastopirellula marina]RCS42357.1 DUF309 domain-containing protein [Bremerella cremea]
MAAETARYEPSLPLPNCAYVPGLFPRPEAPFEGSTPQQSIRYGVDLFNHGFYWEAHEAWESAWIAYGRAGEQADLLRGLIHLAACGVKARQGSRHGVEIHAAKTIAILESVREDLEITSLRSLTECVRKVRETPSRFLSGAQENVVIVFDFPIELSCG